MRNECSDSIVTSFSCNQIFSQDLTAHFDCLDYSNTALYNKKDCKKPLQSFFITTLSSR